MSESDVDDTLLVLILEPNVLEADVTTAHVDTKLAWQGCRRCAVSVQYDDRMRLRVSVIRDIKDVLVHA